MDKYARPSVLCVLLLALTVALPLSAATVMLAPATVAAPLQAKLHDRYGAEEAAVLQSVVAEHLSRAFKAAGVTVDTAAPLRIEVSIEDAEPTHPTRHQVELNPSIEPVSSVSRGGAHLRAVLRSADGKEVDHVDYDYYAMSLDTVSAAGDAWACLLYTSPSPRDRTRSRMPSSA